MLQLPKDIIEAVSDPETMKVLTTTQPSGSPHAVFENSLTVLNDSTLAYLELFELSQTFSNMLHHYWDQSKVSVAIYDAKRHIHCQIKGLPKRLLIEGPVWQLFLGEVWKTLPDANPAGVWLISPEEITDHTYAAMVTEMQKRRANYSLWWSYMGEHRTQ